MATFIVNKNAQSNGDHEVHNATTGCPKMPLPENQVDLGAHFSCHDAVTYAKKQWPKNKINGCYYCCNVCHTS